MASSSSANYSYDVFLSFRGTDTRNNFTSHLHKALCDNNVKAFIDTRIDRGEEITSFLEKIIEGVKLSIIVFSADYASSTFCLDEMAKIMECKETKSQIVLPIFYKVYPNEEMFKEAFARHEQTIVERLKSFIWRALHWVALSLTHRRYEEIISQEMKVEKWWSSFQKALELAGWHIDDNRYKLHICKCFDNTIVELQMNSSLVFNLQLLRNLRVLIIFGARFSVFIPSLVGLEKLRLLNISWNKYLVEIPCIEILINLRVLDLSMNESLAASFPRGVIEKLSHLQTLDLNGSGVEVEPEVLISLEKLEILRVAFYNFHKLDYYLKSRHWQRLMDYHIDYGLWNHENWKKGMCIEGVRVVDEWKGELGIFLPDNIQNLKLGNWEIPISRVLKNRTFVDLQTVHIERYEGRYLFTIDFAQQFLHCVRELCIQSCKYLEEIIAREDEWVDRSNNINYPTIVLSNLKMLSFQKLRRLRSIYRGRMVCPSLELIRISACDEVERLPFYMEEGGTKHHPTIKLQGWNNVTKDWDGPVSRRWWNSLKWDDPNSKSMYNNQYKAANLNMSMNSYERFHGPPQ